MKKKLYIRKNFGEQTDWGKSVCSQIEKFVEYEKDNYEVIDKLVFDENDEVYLIGYNTTEIVKSVIKMRENNIKAHLIENLCYADTIGEHHAACDLMYINEIDRNRKFEFLHEEIKNLFITNVSKYLGYKIEYNPDKFITDYHLDSLDIFSFIIDIEDVFNTLVTPVALTKPVQIKNLNHILEKGYTGNKFKA